DLIEKAFFDRNQIYLPTILTADLNSKPGSDVLSKMEQLGWVDYQERGPYQHHNSIKPKKQIDYVLYRPYNSWKVKDFFIMYGEESSDHLPVVMDLMLVQQ